MSKIPCIIVDDEPIAQRILVKYLSDLSQFEVVATCLNALEAMEVLQNQKIELMFLDIEMPKLKGLAFLKTLPTPPKVIITTAHREYALEGFELEVLDYLLKPISFERFLKAVNRYQKEQSKQPILNEQQEQFLYVKSDRKTVKLKISEVTYIEGLNNYIIIHTHQQKYIVYSSLSDIQKKLDHSFIRIHKSFVINKRFITSYNREIVEVTGVELPIGKSYKEMINKF